MGEAIKKAESGDECSGTTELYEAAGLMSKYIEILDKLLIPIVEEPYLTPSHLSIEPEEMVSFWEKHIEGAGKDFVKFLRIELDFQDNRLCKNEEDHGELDDRIEELIAYPLKHKSDVAYNTLDGDIKKATFNTCRKKRVPPRMNFKYDRLNRCGSQFIRSVLEDTFTEDINVSQKGFMHYFRVIMSKINEKKEAINDINRFLGDEGTKTKFVQRKKLRDWHKNCSMDYALENSKLDYAIWKEWYGNEDKDDEGIQYKCETDNDGDQANYELGMYHVIKHLNQSILRMQDVCTTSGELEDKDHRIQLPCPDWIDKASIIK